MRVVPRPFDCPPPVKRKIDNSVASADCAIESHVSKSAISERICAAIGRWRLAKVAAVFALALSLAPAPASADEDHRLRVMTQNLYVGSFFQELTAAKTLP